MLPGSTPIKGKFEDIAEIFYPAYGGFTAESADVTALAVLDNNTILVYMKADLYTANKENVKLNGHK